MENNSSQIRKCLELYKSYFDQSELLSLAANIIIGIPFSGLKNA